MDVAVIHNYYYDEAALLAEEEPDQIYQLTEKVYEDESYTAELRHALDHSANPENRTVVAEEGEEHIIVLDAETNSLPSITLTYNRSVSTPPPGGGGGGGSTPFIRPDKPTVDIPEEDVPLTEKSVIEIPEEDVSLAKVPKIGDESAHYAVVALASVLGLAYLTFGKKREEELA